MTAVFLLMSSVFLDDSPGDPFPPGPCVPTSRPGVQGDSKMGGCRLAPRQQSEQ